MRGDQTTMDAKGPFPASSFQPHAVDEAPRYPGWVLLDCKAYYADRENGTTAEAQAITGRTVKVTFCLMDPPAVSHFCVHSPGLNSKDYYLEPRVLSSDKGLVLLCFVFIVNSQTNVQDRYHQAVEYFVYSAGRGRPSLTPIPATPPGIIITWSVAIVSCGEEEDGGFLLADLIATSVRGGVGSYALNVFSSKTAAWSTRALQVQVQAQVPVSDIRRTDLFHAAHKVIALGGGMVAWVDLCHGIIVCNILQEDDDLSIHFIPLPKPEFDLAWQGDPNATRDVTFCNGVVKFVEMGHLYTREVVPIDNPQRRFKVTKDLDTTDRLHDRDILLLPHEDLLGARQEQINYIPHGWKIRTCYRHLSWDHWLNEHDVHVDDILVDDAMMEYALSCQRWDACAETLALSKMWDGNVGRITLRNLTTGFPTLSTNADDVVYMMANCHKHVFWMVGVDLRKKTVEILKPYLAERAYHSKQIFLPSTFSEYLNNTTPSVDKVISAPNGPRNYQHTPESSITQNYMPLQQNMSSVDGLYHGSSYGHANGAPPNYNNSNHHHPPSGQYNNLPQGTHPGNANVAFAEGCLGPMHTGQSRYPVPVVYTDAHGKPWIAVPLKLPQSASIMSPGSTLAPFAPPCNTGCGPVLNQRKRRATI